MKNHLFDQGGDESKDPSPKGPDEQEPRPYVPGETEELLDQLPAEGRDEDKKHFIA